MARLSEWERKFRMVGQDVFHVKKLIRDSRGENEAAERRLYTLQEQQIQMLKERIKELENELKNGKGEGTMNTQKIQLEVVLSADTKEFLREMIGRIFGGAEEKAEAETQEVSLIDERESDPEETKDDVITKESDAITKESDTITKTETPNEDAKTTTVPAGEETTTETQTAEESEESKQESKEEVVETPLPTIEELRAVAVNIVTKDQSKEAAIGGLLKEFGAANLSGIPVMERRNFLMRLNLL